MHEETFNINVRKFLKKVGITAQREIERTVTDEIINGNLKGNETLSARAEIFLEGTKLNLIIQEKIPLE